MNKDKKRILIVDDDMDVRFFCQKALDHMGIPTDTARSAEGAQVLMRTGRYKIILMDIRLPKMSGLELCEIMKKKYPDTTIIMMSGTISKNQTDEILEKGAYAFLPKPFTLSELKETIERALKEE